MYVRDVIDCQKGGVAETAERNEKWLKLRQVHEVALPRSITNSPYKSRWCYESFNYVF